MAVRRCISPWVVDSPHRLGSTRLTCCQAPRLAEDIRRLIAATAVFRKKYSRGREIPRVDLKPKRRPTARRRRPRRLALSSHRASRPGSARAREVLRKTAAEHKKSTWHAVSPSTVTLRGLSAPSPSFSLAGPCRNGADLRRVFAAGPWPEGQGDTRGLGRCLSDAFELCCQFFSLGPWLTPRPENRSREQRLLRPVAGRAYPHAACCRVCPLALRRPLRSACGHGGGPAGSFGCCMSSKKCFLFVG